MNKPILTSLPGIYCNSQSTYSRFLTREVKIGEFALGGTNPIRIQSMTTTDTMDTIGTVEQSIRMVEAGCEFVRITAPSIKEARNLAVIKKELKRRGYNVPLIADIHFTPNAAEEAARLVEKVRINPGNYADKKKFENFEYTDLEYKAELDRIYQKFSPLVKVCKEYGTAMRIGTNHGSLSDRIMSHYGDTPQGMVESAMEFMRMCEDLNYYNMVISMKSSNPQVMVQAYRLLVATMVKEGMNYPLHLGVTEAGDGEDGRIKSAVGIGALLEDGLGDTIRVSLTEEPEAEVPVALALAHRYGERELRITNYELRGYVPGASSPSSIKTNNLPTGQAGEQLTNSQTVSDADKFQLYSATDIGGLMLDGFGDGIWLDAPGIGPKTILTTSFGILQATRSRISKTEYISCPSCGRTLFDLQITTQMIRSRTDHLKGLKIGIMGCIVNGPGEMADADYGYVGTGPGKITLYRGKEVVKKNVNTENALDELIGIIKEDGNWVEPEVVNI